MVHDRILVIDDDPGALRLMVSLLRQAGYSPQAIADPQEASSILETSDFDAIVSDVVMPHLNGIQLLEKAKRRNAGVPVVLVTGYGTRELALNALRKGAWNFIQKPFDAVEFLAAVRRALQHRELIRDILVSSLLTQEFRILRSLQGNEITASPFPPEGRTFAANVTDGTKSTEDRRTTS